MCGIAGYVTTKNIHDSSVIKKMTDIIAHRGPNGEGHYIYENIALGHRRLSIIDLSDAGHQPMLYRDRYVITYNGEIYNYIELKKNLEEKGYSFFSNTDTEVILAAYDYWKEGCLNKFNGMWAFVIFDKKKDEFFVSRDRFGIKPLYFYQDQNSFIFASEIKAILEHPDVAKNINKAYLVNYLEKGPKEYIAETAFESIFRFPFASYVKFNRESAFNNFSPKKFWEIKTNLSVERFDQGKALVYAKQYYELLSDAVKLRLRADVKVGSALSGGLDSSSIVYLVNQHLKQIEREELQETFSSVYKTEGTQDCDESLYIDLLAKELSVHSNQIEPQEKDIPQELEKVIWLMENPPESTCMSGWHTFKKAKQKGVVVTLDGQGADEQLAGYLGYIHIYLTSLSLFDMYKEIPNFIKIPGARKHIIVAFAMNHFKALLGEKSLKFLIKKLGGGDLAINLNEKLSHDTNSSLITLIHYSDRVSMGHSIESRMPFMDYRLVEFLASVPACYKMRNGWTKYLARLAFDKKLPDSICWRKDKLGWPIPESHWFFGGLKNWLIEKINDSPLLEQIEGVSKNKIDYKNKKTIRKTIRLLNIALFDKTFNQKANNQ